jgi:hypothetical protein
MKSLHHSRRKDASATAGHTPAPSSRAAPNTKPDHFWTKIVHATVGRRAYDAGV